MSILLERKYIRREPFNGARLTSESVIKELPPPNILDLLAYYQNPRSDQIAKSRPDSIIWSVGLEFRGDIETSRILGSLQPNQFEINYDVVELLRLIARWSYHPSEIHCVYDFDPFTKRDRNILEQASHILLPNGRFITFDYSDPQRSYRTRDFLRKNGWKANYNSLDSSDEMSDWISKQVEPVTKIIAIKGKND